MAPGEGLLGHSRKPRPSPSCDVRRNAAYFAIWRLCPNEAADCYRRIRRFGLSCRPFNRGDQQLFIRLSIASILPFYGLCSEVSV
jgi:hypothetical protein